jgi:D-serine deaminase-like pyridoxal phosphate-dependent protein
MAEVTNDILVAYPPVDPKRIDRLLALPEDVSLKVALDSVEAVNRLSKKAAVQGRRVGVLVEVDLGGARTGVGSVDELLKVAQAAQEAPMTDFLGMLVHPGNLRRTLLDPGDERTWGAEADDQIEKSLIEVDGQLQSYKRALEKSGIPCPIISGGNTPTLFSSHLVTSLTEIRPGTYVYADRDIASQGVLTWTECAYSILATVVSTAVPGQAVIDAGTKAIAKEPLPGLQGFGALLDRPEVVVSQMSEEHGILDLSRSDWKPRVGDRVRVVPNHVCVSVHLQDRVAFADAGALEVRTVAARGR